MSEAPLIKVIIKGIRIPVLLVILMFSIKILDNTLSLDLNQFGLTPLTLKGLLGVITAPLLHADYNHLWSNAVPFIVLGSALFMLYKGIATKILFLSWIVTGLWTWFFARGDSVHIGASGVVYALAAFHLGGAMVRRRYDIAVFSLIVVFLYGSMIWGFFPDFFPEKNISWESHLMGAFTGIILSLIFRKEGPANNMRRLSDIPDEDTTLPWDDYELEGKKKPKVTQTQVTTTFSSPVTYVFKPTEETPKIKKSNSDSNDSKELNR